MITSLIRVGSSFAFTKISLYLWFIFKVARCVSQLKLIMKGDVIAAKQLSLKPTDSSPGECEDSDMGKQRWTSLQFAEATDVINQFLRLKSRKCESCKAKPPKLEKPIFGWVRLVCPLEFCFFLFDILINDNLFQTGWYVSDRHWS